MTPAEVDARVAADHAGYVGRYIKATSVVCSDDGDIFDIDFPEPITLSIDADAGDLRRWMDADHCDPWFYVTLVDAPPASASVLKEQGAHVVAVYGPSYHLDGGYEKPDWKTVATTRGTT